MIPLLGLRKHLTSDTYRLKELRTATWVVPRFGFQYFLPFEKQRINRLIEAAILKAQDSGVHIISLGAPSKNESLNGRGTLFVNKHNDLRIRVVHGNTLTAAVILNELPQNVKKIFITGTTSKLGRAIALQLCNRGVRVLMLTASQNRFEMIQSETRSWRRNTEKTVGIKLVNSNIPSIVGWQVILLL